ncbi:hypothetical protein, partial [Enterobacter hormaechei]
LLPEGVAVRNVSDQEIVKIRDHRLKFWVKKFLKKKQRFWGVSRHGRGGAVISGVWVQKRRF